MKRVVVCGYGRFGRIYTHRAQAHPSLEVVGVVELPAVFDDVRAAGLRPFQNLDEAINETHPHLVIVATPPEHHAACAVTALRRWVHVMLAKPGSLGLDEAARVCATAWNAHRTITVDYTPTEDPAWEAIRSLAFRDGILSVRLTRRGVQRYQDCGALWDLAPHDVALALTLDPDDAVTDVAARAWWYADLEEPVGAFIHLCHKSGRTTRIEVDWMAAADERRVEIIDYERMVVWDQLAGAWGWTRRGYRCDDRARVIGVWDCVPALMPVASTKDNVTRALDRCLRIIDGSGDDSTRLLEITRILEDAENSIYSGGARHSLAH